ncbi:MexE family multidrug efflux RND transporter periplasmic adaptor subunit [Methylopila jiangsuensis]|uniref:MexE family multidrug efflux RND transporter periplasmic adaptor subunit n=1 Tax=Methylopila jiangsuensis TaxID=586230 RepID=A0A9W6N4W9_9HYPH|nr:efflux RND transporter periplasmic adaptor subunit [Methylopila jiangsuensis]MDR6284836.1 RND family efflux transporter MFP subunit [Methylopila jiangsuensis]GLK77773.1 MexE family multidrug efflux RND transporter periplasmic adaptor subunit [Methylopila jiangsuensis]
MVVGVLAVAASLQAAPARAQGAPGPLPVSVAHPIKRAVTDTAEFTGRFEASELVEVRAQVSGQLMQVAFKDGSLVKKGDLLFKIDPRPYEAALTQAESAVITAKTRVDLTKSDVDRAKDLLRTGNITDQLAQQRNQAYGEAQASLKSAEAQVQTARLNLEWTDVRAPIDGRIGRKLVTEGNLIAAGAGSSALTTIVNVQPIYFYFDIDEQSYLRYLRNVRDGKIQEDNGGAQVEIALPDTSEFNIKGRIDFADNQLDQQTGTLRLRASVPNENGFLTSGVFGRIRIQASPEYEAVLLPEEAILSDQTRKVVMTVGPEDKVVPKVVELGQLHGPLRVIRSGVTVEDRVIVNGLMRARPGAAVKPEPVDFTKPKDQQPGAAAQQPK